MNENTENFDDVETVVTDSVAVEHAEDTPAADEAAQADAALGEKLAELETLQNEIQAKQAEMRDGALRRIADIAKAAGLSFEDIAAFMGPVNGKRRGARGPVPAKYRGPNGETWTGRGRKPRWVEKALADGIALETMKIA